MQAWGWFLLARRASGFLSLVSSIRLYMEKKDNCVYLVQTCLKLCEDVRHGKRWWAAEVQSEEGGVPWLVAEDGWGIISLRDKGEIKEMQYY